MTNIERSVNCRTKATGEGQTEMLNPSHKVSRDLLAGMDYVRGNGLITQRQYNYGALGRPMTRDTRYPNKAIHHADTFAYNKRGESPRGLGVGLDNAQALSAGRTSDGAVVSQSARRLAGRLDKSAAFTPKGRSIDGAMLSQLTGALLDENAYAYAYDNIGNREIAQEVTEGITYAANDLNQYTRISMNSESMRRGKKLRSSSENSNHVIKKLVVKWDCSCIPKKSEGSLSISNS